MALALAMVVLGMPPAAGQPKIPSTEMPARERERFTDNPVERFMKPGPHIAPSAVDTARPPKKAPKRRGRHHKH
jgi:hypothetical protein